jgi:hypothetical protein
VDVIAEQAFDLVGADEKVRARVYAPILEADDQTWACRVQVDDPIGIDRVIYGESSMQALVLGLSTLSVYLYASHEYKAEQLGIGGEFGGDLRIPAQRMFLENAPYPF